MEKAPILVVDDEPCAVRYMTLALAERFQPIRSASGGVEALLAIERELPALVISDLRMPDLDGLELLTLIKERWPEVPFILVTVEQDVATVVEAVKRGATNYLVKPISPAALCTAVSRALATTSLVHSAADRSVPEIVGSSPATIRARHLVSLAARSDVNVLITGETGTGKELVARAIHRLSSLARGPFVAHNCAVTPTELFESQFFGHRRGAFTSAERDQAGLLEEADGGVLVLDELECLSLAHQAKLLRVLDDGEVRPVGSRESKAVSVRFLSATNRDPSSMLAEGTLREDLYYRLRGLEICLSPLREHPRDIPALVEHFLKDRSVHVASEALETLQQFHWPGNARQLRNALNGAVALARGGTIERRHLTLDLAATKTRESARFVTGYPGSLTTREGKTMKQAERDVILQALRSCDGNRSRTARTLGIHRSTLRRKMHELGIPSGP